MGVMAVVGLMGREQGCGYGVEGMLISIGILHFFGYNIQYELRMSRM